MTWLLSFVSSNLEGVTVTWLLSFVATNLEGDSGVVVICVQ